MMSVPSQSLEVCTPVECAPAQFYLGLFTVESWREFKRHGGEVMGFTDKKKGMAARLNVGDRLLCYVCDGRRERGWIRPVESGVKKRA